MLDGHDGERERTGPERIDTVVIGGGQAGLSVGYQLARRGVPFVILDASERIGDSWRNRWESLRLFTPARFDGLAGMKFPADPNYFPTKDEMGDYLQSYARHFDLPVRSGVRVDRVAKNGKRYVVETDGQRYEASNVVVAMSTFQRPRVPSFAEDLDPDIVQIHSADYRSPTQLREGGVLIVGAGNSGAEIASELVKTHPTWLAGRDVGQVPFDITGFVGRHVLIKLVIQFLFHRVMTVKTPMGRKARPKVLAHSIPLIRTKRKHLRAAGVEFASRVSGVRDGKPLLDDGRTLDVANVIWCTGYHPGFSWIDLPIHGEFEPEHERGISQTQRGLYFLGLEFLYSFSSVMIYGLERDSARIADDVLSRQASRHPKTKGQAVAAG